MAKDSSGRASGRGLPWALEDQSHRGQGWQMQSQSGGLNCTTCSQLLEPLQNPGGPSLKPEPEGEFSKHVGGAWGRDPGHTSRLLLT